jgi:hypothetical protein
VQVNLWSTARPPETVLDGDPAMIAVIAQPVWCCLL